MSDTMMLEPMVLEPMVLEPMVLEQGRIDTLGTDELTRLRVLAVVGLVVLNVCDLVLTRHLLARGAFEANPLMALFIGGGWGIAIKVGVPILTGVRHLTAPLLRKAVLALCWVNVAYLSVVTWNLHVLSVRLG